MRSAADASRSASAHLSIFRNDIERLAYATAVSPSSRTLRV